MRELLGMGERRKACHGGIQIIPYGNAMKSDCSMGENSTEWKAIMPNGTLVEPGTAGTLKIDRTSASDATLRINTGVTTQTTDSKDRTLLSKIRRRYRA